MTLKTKNLPLYFGFIITLYYLFALLNQLPIVSNFQIVIKNGIIKFDNPIFTLSYPIIAIIINNIFSSMMKARIVYLRWNNPLPGTRIFSEIAIKDDRISFKEIEKKYGHLPKPPSEQNKLWYKIYKEKENDKVVLASQGTWLLLRDLLCTSLLLSVPMILYSFIFVSLVNGIKITLMIGCISTLLWITARNSGNRFACNVIAR